MYAFEDAEKWNIAKYEGPVSTNGGDEFDTNHGLGPLRSNRDRGRRGPPGPYRGGYNRRDRNSGYGRGGYGGGGYGGERRNYFPSEDREKHLLRLKLVKLGDAPERLVVSVRETAKVLDAFLGQEFYKFKKPVLPEDVDLTQLTGKYGEGFEHQQQPSQSLLNSFLSQCPNEEDIGPKMKNVLALMLECVETLPHKHSYYATLVWTLIGETLRPGMTIAQVIEKAYEGSALKGETVEVKGEIFEDESGDVDVKGETFHQNNPDRGGGGLPIEVKGAKAEYQEQNNGASSPPKTGLEPTVADEKCLFYVVFTIALIKRAWASLQANLYQTGGLHKVSNSMGILRFLADAVNLTLLDPRVLMDATDGFLDAAEQLMAVAQTDPSARALTEHLIMLGGSIPIWLSRERIQEVIGWITTLVERVEKLVASRASWSTPERSANELRKFLFPLANWQSSNGGETMFDALHGLSETLRTNLQRGWVSKSVPRLYESPRLQESRQRPINLGLKLTALARGSFLGSNPAKDNPSKAEAADLPMADLGERGEFVEKMLAGWKVYAFHDTDNDAYQYSAKKKREPVPQFHSPPSELFWKEDMIPMLPWSIFSTECLEEFLDVQLLSSADVWVTRTYIHDSLANFFRDADNCAETLLYIPLKHDQFPCVLVEALFSFLLNHRAPLTDVSLKSSGRISAFFLCQLLQRLCILEKSLEKIVHLAIEQLLRSVANWDEQFFHQFAFFLALWCSYDKNHCRTVMKLLSDLDGVHEKISLRKAEEATEMTNMSSPLKRIPIKSEDGAVPTHINSPLDDFEVFKTASIRFVSHVLVRLKKIVPLQAMGDSIPPSMKVLIPKYDSKSGPGEVRKFEGVGMKKEDEEDGATPHDIGATNSQQPLEATVLKKILKLLVKDQKEATLLCQEAFNFIKSRLGHRPIVCIDDETMQSIDGLLASYERKGEETETRDEKPVKRAREEEPEMDSGREKLVKMEEPEISAVDYEAGAGKDTSSVVPADSMPIVKDEGGLKDDGGEEKFDGGMITDDVMEDLPTDRIASIQFVEAPESHSYVWTHGCISKMLTNTIVQVGSKTMSHFQKTLDLYTPLINQWRKELNTNFPSKEETSDAAVEPKGVSDLELTIINSVVETWFNRDLPKLQWCLHLLLTYGVIQPTTLIASLVNPETILGVPIGQTVTGDYVFWDWMESCLRLSSKNHVHVDLSVTKGIIGSDLMEDESNESKTEPLLRKPEDEDSNANLLYQLLEGSVRNLELEIRRENSLMIEIYVKRCLHILKMVLLLSSENDLPQFSKRLEEDWTSKFPAAMKRGNLSGALSIGMEYRKLYEVSKGL